MEYATQREFDDFRTETRDEIKFIRRLLIGTLGTAVLSSAFSSVVMVVFR